MGRITVTHSGDMLFESTLGNHTVKADAPLSMMGEDRAPIPPQYFLFSLGSCIAAFVAHYCEKNGINNEGISVEILFDKSENEDRFINLKALIRVPKGDLKGREEAILRVAQKCFVSLSIEKTGEIPMELVT